MDDWYQFVDRETGEVWEIPPHIIGAVEEGDEEALEAEEESLAAAARLTLDENRMVALPDKEELNDWEIMRDFAESQTKRDRREQLLTAISGRGAFRVFKDTVARLGIPEQWFDFRHKALREIAIEFCKDNDLAWVEGRRQMAP